MAKIFNEKEITKEDFWKLSQLDRIEYRQRLQIIKDEHIDIGLWSFINGILWVGIIIALFGVVLLGYNPEEAVKMFSILPLLFELGVWIAFFLLILQQVFNYRTYKLKKELINEYFPCEIKVKGTGKK